MGRPAKIKLPGLARERKRALLTQRQLAERAGLFDKTISRLENGGECYLRTAAAIATALDIQSDLLTGESPRRRWDTAGDLDAEREAPGSLPQT